MYKFGVVCDLSLPHPNPPALSKGRGQEPPLYKLGRVGTAHHLDFSDY